MSRRHSTLAIIVVGLAAVAGWLYTQPAAAAVLSAQDAHEIEQLYATMYHGADFRDADLWLSTFADDGVFELPTGRRVEGMQALREYREGSFRGQVGDTDGRHSATTIRMTPTSDGEVAVRAYWVLLDVSARPAAIGSTGTVDDVAVKTAEGWKFKTKAVHVGGMSR